MLISQGKPVEALFEECREFDIVLVPDQPSGGGALNRRLSEPQFEPFIVRPRRRAAGRRERDAGRAAFLQVIRATNMS